MQTILSLTETITHKPNPPPPVTRRTFAAVSGDALPDNELPLPQHCPDQIPGATTDLEHLPRDRHLLPHGALRIVVIDSHSEPHLDGGKSDSRTVTDQHQVWDLAMGSDKSNIHYNTF